MVKRVNLEGILYNEDGTFKPMSSNHGNTSKELAELRNNYMEAEREYFECLLADQKVYEDFVSILEEDSEEILKAAIRIQKALEYGELETPAEKKQMESMTPEEREKFHMKKLEVAEAYMCLLYAAVRDKAKIEILVRTPSGGRSK